MFFSRELSFDADKRKVRQSIFFLRLYTPWQNIAPFGHFRKS